MQEMYELEFIAAGECILGVHTLSLNNCGDSQSSVVDEVVLGPLDIV